MPDLVVGAQPVQIEGPASILHEGGDEIYISDQPPFPDQKGELSLHVTDTLHYEGVENEAEQVFNPSPEADRTYEVLSRGVWVQARGQANLYIERKVEEPDPKPVKKAAAKKPAAKKPATTPA